MRRSKVLGAALCAVLLVAGSCSSGDVDDGTSAAAGGDEAAVAAVGEAAGAGAPVPVTMELEAATASTTTVGPDGANIGATAADGTEYVLRIPRGALADPVDIVMTPLLGLTGLPDGADLAFGVSLEPSGLVFARPSWLFVSSEVEPDDVTGLSIHEGAATLAGIGFDGEHFVLPVAHFSGNGACFARCGGPGWPDFPDSPPGGPGSPGGPGGPGGPPATPPGPDVPPFESPGTPPGPFPGDDGGDATSGGGEPDRGSLTDGMTGVSSSSSSSSSTDRAVADAVQDLGEAQLNGDEEAEAAAEAELDKVKERVKDEAWKAAKACVEEKDITKLKDLLHWLTVGQVLGAANDDAEDAQLTSLIAVCYRFEMDATAEVIAEFGGQTFVIGDSIDLTVPLLYTGGVSLEGETTGPVDPTGYDRGAEMIELLGVGLGAFVGVDVPNDIAENDYFDCSTAPGTGTLVVVATNLLTAQGPSVNVVPSIASDATVTCPDPIGSFPIPPFVVDLPVYTEAGFPGAGEAGLLFEDWKVLDSEPFATKSESHRISEDGGEIRFSWDLVLTHAPAALPPR